MPYSLVYIYWVLYEREQLRVPGTATVDLQPETVPRVFLRRLPCGFILDKKKQKTK